MVIKIIINLDMVKLSKNIEWDVFLSFGKHIKHSIFMDSSSLDDIDKRKILEKNIPRFIWRAIAIFDGIPNFELLFDATDIERGNCYLQCIEYNKEIVNQIYQSLLLLNQIENINNYFPVAWPILNKFISERNNI